MVAYLTADDILRINERETGRSSNENLISRDNLESAVGRPQASAGLEDAFPSVHEKAAALFVGLVQSHAFVLGNKRTAVLATYQLYGLNGYVFERAEHWELFDVAVAAAQHELDVAEVAARFAEWAEPIPDVEE